MERRGLGVERLSRRPCLTLAVVLAALLLVVNHRRNGGLDSSSSIQRQVHHRRLAFDAAAFRPPSRRAIDSVAALPQLIASARAAVADNRLGRTSDGDRLVAALFDAEETEALSYLPPRLRSSLVAKGWPPASYEHQSIVTISSRVLPWEALSFNPVRAKRFAAPAQAVVPRDGAARATAVSDETRAGRGARSSAGAAGGGGGVESRGEETVGGAAKEALALDLDRRACIPDDLCRPFNSTMADASLGYLHNGDAVVFANMGRVTALHGVVVSRRTPNPLRLRRRDLRAMYSLAAAWFVAARSAHGSAATYPTLSFDTLPSGGASQLHPHLQTRLGRSRYAGKWEAVRTGGDRHDAGAGILGRGSSPLFRDLAAAYAHLGLCFARSDRFAAFVSLTSPGSAVQLEIIGDDRRLFEEGAALAAAQPSAAAAGAKLGDFVFDVLRAAHAAFQWDGYSSSCAFPPLGALAATDAPAYPARTAAHSAPSSGSLDVSVFWPDGMQPVAAVAAAPTDGAGAGARTPAGGLPWVCRFVGRGSFLGYGGPAGQPSDISANELYELPVVPFDLVLAAERLAAAWSGDGAVHYAPATSGAAPRAGAGAG